MADRGPIDHRGSSLHGGGREAGPPDGLRAVDPSPILLAYGAWAGWDTGRRGGFGLALVAGAILGLLPVALDVVGFGLILGRGFDAGVTAGAFGWLAVVFGAILGGGIAVSRPSSATGASGVGERDKLGDTRAA